MYFFIVVIFHLFAICSHAAVKDYRDIHGITETIIPIGDDVGVYWRKKS